MFLKHLNMQTQIYLGRQMLVLIITSDKHYCNSALQLTIKKKKSHFYNTLILNEQQMIVSFLHGKVSFDISPPETQKNSRKCLRWLVSSFKTIHTFRQNRVSRVSISAPHWTSSADFKEECDLWQWLCVPKPSLEIGKPEPERKEVLLPMGSCHAPVRRLPEGQLIRRFLYTPFFYQQGCWMIKTSWLPIFLFTLRGFEPLHSTSCCITFIDPFCHLQKNIAVWRTGYKSG